MEEVWRFVDIYLSKLMNKLIMFSIFLSISLLYINSMYRTITLIVTFVLLTSYFILKNGKISKYYFVHLLFLVWCVISLLWTINLERSLSEINRLILINLFSLLLINYIDSEDKFENLMRILVYSGLFFLGFILLNVPLDILFRYRLGSTLEQLNPNAIGLNFMISSLASYYLMMKHKKIKWGILLITFILPLMLSASRKAIIMFVFAITIYSLLKSSNPVRLVKNIFFLLIGSVLIFALIMNVEFLYNIIGYRMEGLLNVFSSSGSVDGSTALRTRMISKGIELFSNNPILGYGVGGYTYVSGFDTYSHNNFIEVLVGTGLVGFLIYYSLYTFILVSLIRNIRFEEVKLGLAMFLAFLIFEISLVTYDEIVYQLAMIIIPIISIRVNLIKQQSGEKYWGNIFEVDSIHNR